MPRRYIRTTRRSPPHKFSSFYSTPRAPPASPVSLSLSICRRCGPRFLPSFLASFLVRFLFHLASHVAFNCTSAETKCCRKFAVERDPVAPSPDRETLPSLSRFQPPSSHRDRLEKCFSPDVTTRVPALSAPRPRRLSICDLPEERRREWERRER